jgi:DNA repair exonuclease SbcCD ATPase subunit/DNA repair exonuclease SbcCD nuclease subunit
MDIRHIDTGIEKIDKIFHISDVHIRTLKRHKEYRQVFENLFNYIETHATGNSVAVVTGDIVHSKLDMSPELVQMLVDFFNGFTIPTVVILGNHDMNLNNMHRVDAVSPVLDVIKNPNIHFIKENGLFELGGATWNHMAVDKTPVDYIRAKEFDATYKIAMHHGAVNTAKTDIGYQISNEHVGVDLFEGYDITLLGDIHKPAQFLDDAKTIAYPGSLIQQNHGEALIHGILVWDVERRTADFVEIENEYGYVTIETQGASIVNAPARIPKRPRVRIKFNGTSAADMKKLIASIRKKYAVEDITIQRTIGSTEIAASSSLAIGNVRDVEYQNTLLTEYIDNNFPQATTQEQDAIRHINRTINSKLPAVESVRHTTWHPISFEFDNMFSYGEGNILNFENLQDVCGLFAANTSGKSSLLDAITYTIFDKCSKTGKANEVLNNKKDWFRGVFRFEMNGIIYTIERRGTQNKKKETHVKVDVDFYTESENLNGEERSETNKNIRRYLGTYDDFILTAFSLQADNNNFIEKSQKERKDLLSQFLDITVFEQLYQLAADEIKETAGRLKEYKKTDFAEIMIQADAVISANQDTIQTLETQEDKAQEYRNDLQNHIVNLIESKLPTTYDGPDIDVLAQQETKLVDKIETLQTDIETAEQEISEFKQRNAELKSLMQTHYNLKEIQTNIETHNKLLEAHNEILVQIKTQQGVIDAKEQKIKHLDAHEYDPKCKYCTSNVFVQDAIEAQDTIDSDRAILTELERRFDALETDIEAVSIYQVQRDELTYYSQTYKVTATDIERKELRLQLLESELQTRESELETCLERQESFTKNETAIKHNRRIDLKIGLCKDDIEMYTEDIKEIQSQIKSLFGAIEVAKTNRSTALKNLESYQQLETEYKAYEYYLAAVQRNGIPYELVAKALPKIESEINNVLNQIVEFNMVLNTDGKNINGYIIYDEDNYWPLELTSGMERFISSLAIRIALINVSALPRPNFIAIDEGWGSLDSEHISAVVNLFDYFRTKFDFSIIISHVDSMRDMVDNLIEVNKTNGFSCILHS